MRNYRKKLEECRKMGKGYYHLVTDGWKEGNIFNNVAQFAYGMTLIGLITLKYSINIYDFTLMPNHIHIILSGTGNDAVEAFLYLKRKLNVRLLENGFKPLPDNYSFKMIPIEDERQMRDLIIYIDRNHYEKMLSVPGGYPWGSAYLHYSMLGLMIKGKKVSDMTVREVQAWTASKTELPPHWQIHPVFGLLPISFINTRFVKKLFKNAKDYATHLIKDYETCARIAGSIGEEIDYDDSDVNEIVSTLLIRDYQGRTLSQLDGNEKGHLAVTLARQYSILPDTIARALSLSVHLVNQFLSAKDYRKQIRNSYGYK